MTDHVRRLYLAAGSLLAFFLAWAGIAAHPWTATPPTSPGAAEAKAVALYQQRLLRDAALLRRLSRLNDTDRRASPPVRVLALPPLTTTRTS